MAGHSVPGDLGNVVGDFQPAIDATKGKAKEATKGKEREIIGDLEKQTDERPKVLKVASKTQAAQEAFEDEVESAAADARAGGRPFYGMSVVDFKDTIEALEGLTRTDVRSEEKDGHGLAPDDVST
jgi:hypothetical protein